MSTIGITSKTELIIKKNRSNKIIKKSAKEYNKRYQIRIHKNILDPGDNKFIYIHSKKAIESGVAKFSISELNNYFSKQEIIHYNKVK